MPNIDTLNYDHHNTQSRGNSIQLFPIHIAYEIASDAEDSMLEETQEPVFPKSGLRPPRSLRQKARWYLLLPRAVLQYASEGHLDRESEALWKTVQGRETTERRNPAAIEG